MLLALLPLEEQQRPVLLDGPRDALRQAARHGGAQDDPDGGAYAADEAADVRVGNGAALAEADRQGCDKGGPEGVAEVQVVDLLRFLPPSDAPKFCLVQPALDADRRARHPKLARGELGAPEHVPRLEDDEEPPHHAAYEGHPPLEEDLEGKNGFDLHARNVLDHLPLWEVSDDSVLHDPPKQVEPHAAQHAPDRLRPVDHQVVVVAHGDLEGGEGGGVEAADEALEEELPLGQHGAGAHPRVHPVPAAELAEVHQQALHKHAEGVEPIEAAQQPQRHHRPGHLEPIDLRAARVVPQHHHLVLRHAHEEPQQAQHGNEEVHPVQLPVHVAPVLAPVGVPVIEGGPGARLAELEHALPAVGARPGRLSEAPGAGLRGAVGPGRGAASSV
mmetsp:Transcript_29377/g.74496  ORF Transcript_29377/g.74496 Transcript_29377/m.74496 type:complete len:388 (-) Transcript_29377:458-1621(-)